MFIDEEISPEEESEIIEWIAKQFYRYGLETAAIMFLESLKPISRYGSSMGQVFISPLLPILGDNLMFKGDKAMRVLQEDANIEKLIQRLEVLASEGDKEDIINKEESKQEKDETPKEKKGWRRYLPF
jgi:hypothetical protein